MSPAREPRMLCWVCHGTPKWALTRSEDPHAAWACSHHMEMLADSLQRMWRVSELVVTMYRTGPDGAWAPIDPEVETIR